MCLSKGSYCCHSPACYSTPSENQAQEESLLPLGTSIAFHLVAQGFPHGSLRAARPNSRWPPWCLLPLGDSVGLSVHSAPASSPPQGTPGCEPQESALAYCDAGGEPG